MATTISQEEMNQKLSRIKEEPDDYFENPTTKVLSEDERAKIDADGLKTHIKIVFKDLPNHDKLVQKETIEFLKLEVVKIRADYQKEVSDLMTSCLFEHLKKRNSILYADIAMIMEEAETPPVQTSKGTGSTESCEGPRPPYSITVAPLPQPFYEAIPPMQPSQVHQVHRQEPPIFNQGVVNHNVFGNNFQYPFNPPMPVFNYQIPMSTHAPIYHPPPPYVPPPYQPEPPKPPGITSTQQMENYLQEHLNQQKSVMDVIHVPPTKPVFPPETANIATGVIRVGPPTRGPPSPDAVPQKIKRVRRTTTRKPKEKCNHASCQQFRTSQQPKPKTKAEIDLEGYKAHFSSVFDSLHTISCADRTEIVKHLFETAFKAMPEIKQECIDHLYICMNTFMALQQMGLYN
ncbi:hypothetical protein CAEBREN_20721 [Caenorhabditis brenneri]|uniref:Uncharacterized protein n=1 Tax=Caenorhabditis brenneri TaxID=135651 RepID=G0P4H1_CAEBE|nr:hypothetical protein CAEBREN_20721 [Caenorhabditis brenneri]